MPSAPRADGEKETVAGGESDSPRYAVGRRPMGGAAGAAQRGAVKAFWKSVKSARSVSESAARRSNRASSGMGLSSGRRMAGWPWRGARGGDRLQNVPVPPSVVLPEQLAQQLVFLADAPAITGDPGKRAASTLRALSERLGPRSELHPMLTSLRLGPIMYSGGRGRHPQCNAWAGNPAVVPPKSPFKRGYNGAALPSRSFRV